MNARILKITLFTLLISLLIPGLSFAKPVLPEHTKSFYVNDFANVMDEKTENYMVNYGIRLHQNSGAQVVVVTVDSTEGTPIEEYATDLFNKWGVGSAEKNNGLLLLLAIEDDDYWAVPGKGIENTLTSGKISQILSNSLEPDFAVKNYSSGVRKTYGEFIQILGGTWVEETGSKNYVADNAGVLKKVSKDYLNQSSNRYQATTGTGVYVVTVKNTGDRTLQDYTYMKFSSVGAGPKDVMLVLDIEGDDYHVLQGKDIDRILTNDDIGGILDSVLEPYFAQKDYSGGATATANAFYSYFLARAEQPQAAAVSSGNSSSSSGTTAAAGLKQETDFKMDSQTFYYLIFGFIALIVIIGISTSRRNRYLALYGVPFNPYTQRSVRRYGTWDGYGGASYNRYWNNRRYRRSHTYSAPSQQSSFWGNSGGGGSSNGGGAGRHSSSSRDDHNSGGGGSSSGGGAGRHSSGGGSHSGGGSSGGGGSASSGGGAGRHR